ncbi:MAG: HK97 family phage prohead protease [Flavobacteriaceae bacterium]|nr:HK97 family phage prohead protease [Flavobacteriaceae bacterium]
MKHSNFDAPLELKFLAETGVFEGYASVFNVTDKVNDKITSGAFKASLQKFRDKGILPPLLWQHNTSEPIGRWVEMYEDKHGLFVKGELFIDDIKLAKEALKLLQEKVVTGLSIGYRVEESYREQKSGVRILTKVDLQEVSLVTFPANEYARVSKIKKPASNENKIPSEREFESLLRNTGLSRRQAKGVIALGYKGLSPVSDKNAELDAIADLKNRMLQAAAELKK